MSHQEKQGAFSNICDTENNIYKILALVAIQDRELHRKCERSELSAA
jgi:hypothetical protein